MTTAAGIIIGDEILSGKVQDTNAQLLIQLLHEVGVSLRRIATIGDDPAEIAEEVARCAGRYDYVFTSGGLGPTHDDRTMEGVARAFSCPVLRHPQLEELVRRHWGARLNEAALKMTEVPTGSRLVTSNDSLFPLVVCQNVYILPGVPQLFAAKLSSLRHELAGHPEPLRRVFLRSDETSIAALLSQVVQEFPQVRIGSYPRLGNTDYRVLITLEGGEPEENARATRRLLELLPPDQVIRVED